MYSFDSHHEIEGNEFWSYRPLYKKRKKKLNLFWYGCPCVFVCVCLYVYVQEMIGLEEQSLCSTSYNHTSLSQTCTSSWHSRIIHVFVSNINLQSQFLTFPGVMAGSFRRESGQWDNLDTPVQDEWVLESGTGSQVVTGCNNKS